MLSRCGQACFLRPLPSQAFQPVVAVVPTEEFQKLAPAAFFSTWKPNVWQCGLLIFFFLPMHPRTWRGLEEDLGLLSACQGIFPDNSSFVGILGSEMGAVVLGSQPGVLGCIPTSSSTVGGWPEGSSFGGVSSAGLNRACPRVQCVCSSGGGGAAPDTVLHYHVPAVPGKGFVPTLLSHCKFSVLMQKKKKFF